MIIIGGKIIRHAFLDGVELEGTFDTEEEFYNFLKYLFTNENKFIVNADGNCTIGIDVKTNSNNWNIK